MWLLFLDGLKLPGRAAARSRPTEGFSAMTRVLLMASATHVTGRCRLASTCSVDSGQGTVGRTRGEPPCPLSTVLCALVSTRARPDDPAGLTQSSRHHRIR